MTFRWGIAGAAAGLGVVSLLVVTGVAEPGGVDLGSGRTPNPPAAFLPGEGPEAAETFLAAFLRSRQGTWAVEQVHTRTLPSGQIVNDTRHQAQAPGRRLIETPVSVDLIDNGRRSTCATGPDGQQHCEDDGPAPDLDAQNRTDLANLRTYVTVVAPARSPVYAVREEGQGCWVLRLVLARVSAPFGDRATFCFDLRTAAPVFTEDVRPEATDQVRTVAQRPPTAADFTPGAVRPG